MAFFSVNEPASLPRLQEHPEFDAASEIGGAAAFSDLVGATGSWHIIGDEDDPTCPGAVFAHLPAGYVVPRHTHDCHRLEVIVHGSMTVLDDGRVLGPGDVMISRSGEYYGPHQVGPDGCTTVEFFGRRDGLAPRPEGGITMYEALMRDNAHLLKGSK